MRASFSFFVSFAALVALVASAGACGDGSGDGSLTNGGDGTGAPGAAGGGGGGGDGTSGSSGGAGAAGDPLDPSLAPAVDTDPDHYPHDVWVTPATAKVRATDGPPASGAAKWAFVWSARDAIESFQVHVHAATSALAGVSFDVSDLVDARSGVRIVAATDVTVSRELYLDISSSHVSDANGVSGLVPDALVPARDPYFDETRRAFPVDVDAGKNASAWIDVHVPPGTPSGWYVGSVRVTTGGGAATLATIPVRLGVWQVDLPPTASLRSSFSMSWSGACVAHYGSYEACGQAVSSGASPDDGVEHFHELYARFALDHRVSIGSVVYAGPSGDDWTHFDALYGPLLDGTAKTRTAGAKLTSIDYAGATDPATLARWASHFRSKGWLDRLAFYHCDEPASGHSCSFAQALDEETTVHAAAADMRTLLTASVEDVSSHGLLDAVDVLTPVVDQMQPHGEASHRPAYDAFLQRSPQKTLFWYQSCDEHESCDTGGSPGPATATWPSYMADASPVRNRVFQWLAYLFRVNGELYYQTDLCFTESCGGAHDPFTSIYAFSGNGDGTLFYPGKPAAIGGTHDVPLSSLRFELVREGMQDYELLHALDAAGLGAFAAQTAAGFIRRADDFDGDPGHLESARLALGDRLHRLALGK